MTTLVLGTACPSDPDPGTDTEGPSTTATSGPGTNPDATGNTVDPDTGMDTDDPGGLGGECPLGERVGAFDILLEESYSAINGEIRAALVQTTLYTVEAEEGECRLVTTENPFCDPPCGGGEVCTISAQCVAFPERIAVGTVTITGMEVPVAMEPAADQRYFETELPHPAFVAGAEIELQAEGLSLSGSGFSALGGVTPELYIAPET
ncbi:MAG: hypothetical protein KDK70_12940, partial [Myxococcales bacterium]|nr:hypothetical protein [Myxococcales bacterium]